MSMSRAVCLLSQAAVTIFTWSASLDQTVASHSQVNSEYIRDYYSWIRRLTEKECVRAPNGAPPQFLPDPPSCDLCLCPPALHYTDLMEYSSHPITGPVKSQIICNFIRLLQRREAVVITATGCDYTNTEDWPIRGQHGEALTNQRPAWEIRDSPGVILILAPSFGPISTDIKIINCLDI